MTRICLLFFVIRNLISWLRWYLQEGHYFGQIKHDDVIKWKHFPRYWSFVRGIHGSPVNYPHKGQWCGALMFSLICAWIHGWVNNREAVDLGRHLAHYDVIMTSWSGTLCVCMWMEALEPHNQICTTRITTDQLYGNHSVWVYKCTI